MLVEPGWLGWTRHPYPPAGCNFSVPQFLWLYRTRMLATEAFGVPMISRFLGSSDAQNHLTQWMALRYGQPGSLGPRMSDF